MTRALVYKELREIALIVAVAAGFYAFLLGSLIDRGVADEFNIIHNIIFRSNLGSVGFPFITGYDTARLFTVGAAFAVTLGFWQALTEMRGARIQFLLHRPLGRGRILATKALVGIGVLMCVAAAPILGYAWWCSRPGHVAPPFLWSMTETAWRAWLVLPVIYLSALLAGLGPGRWFGTRLLPLVPAGVFYLPAYEREATIPIWVFASLLVTLALLYAAACAHLIRNREFS